MWNVCPTILPLPPVSGIPRGATGWDGKELLFGNTKLADDSREATPCFIRNSFMYRKQIKQFQIYTQVCADISWTEDLKIILLNNAEKLAPEVQRSSAM